jgi:hypothetical protein
MMEMGDVKRVVERLDGNLEAYEQAERQRRQDSVMAATKQKALDAVIVVSAMGRRESFYTCTFVFDMCLLFVYYHH